MLPLKLLLAIQTEFCWLQKRLFSTVRPSDPDVMSNTALEATASSSRKTYPSVGGI